MNNFCYFRKLDPSTKVLMGDGTWLQFSKVDDDTGSLIVGKPYWIAQIRAVIASGKGGVEEITAEEYAELQKKKNQASSTGLREQVSNQQIRDIGRAKRDGAARADGVDRKPAGKVPRGTIQAVEYKPVVPGFRPGSVKR
jgi:hypothetical protein